MQAVKVISNRGRCFESEKSQILEATIKIPKVREADVAERGSVKVRRRNW